MKKLLGMCIFSFILTACAGNPPSWWNPGGIYSSPANQETTSANAKSPAQTLPPPEVQAEQTIPVNEEEFEEMTLTPMQDEEGENDSGDASAQSVPEPTDALPAPSILD